MKKIPPFRIAHLLFTLLLLGVVAVTGCKGASFPAPESRASARQVVLATTLGVRIAANVCIAIIEDKADTGDEDGAREFGNACKNILLPVMVTAKAAAKAVDTWNDDANAIEKVGCLAKAFVQAEKDWEVLVKKEGAAIPPAVTDAVPFANVVVKFAGSSCQ